MSDMKVEVKESLTRQQVADRLSALAAALAGDGALDVELGDAKVTLDVPDDLRSEFEVQIDGDTVELELEFKWSTARAEPAAAPAHDAEKVRNEPRAIPSL